MMIIFKMYEKRPELLAIAMRWRDSVLPLISSFIAQA